MSRTRTSHSESFLKRAASRIGTCLLTLCFLLASLCGGRMPQEELERDCVAASASSVESRHVRVPRSSRGEQLPLSRHLRGGNSHPAIRKATGQPILVEGHALANGLRAPLLS